MSTLTASAPGKLVVLGEYAVLDGAPALVLAVDRRVRVMLESKGSLDHPTTRHPGESRDPVTFAQTSENQSHWQTRRVRGSPFGPSASPMFAPASCLRSPDVAARLRNDEQISNAVGGDDAWQIVSPTLGMQARLQFRRDEAAWIDTPPPELAWVATVFARVPQLTHAPPCRIELDSAPFYFEHGGAQAKLGLGSSAALTVALLGALHAHARLAAPKLAETMAAHRAIQGGRGSGIDIAAAYTGGLSRFQLQAGTARVQPATLPGGLHWCCVYSGRATSTSAMLAQVAAWRAREPDAFGQRIHELATISSRGIDAVTANDAAAFLSSLHDYANALARFGEAAGADIASREQRAIGALAADCGCVYKSCGAGGGDVGITFAVEDTRLRGFATRAARAGYPVIDLHADPQGLAVASTT